MKKYRFVKIIHIFGFWRLVLKIIFGYMYEKVKTILIEIFYDDIIKE